ncbi:MAG: SDR family oxidoreductase [Nitrospirae bacterium]|nr:SDR family oxidoreductase [Nitrospirota bacterium]
MILIAGATTEVGRRVVRRLIEERRCVRVMVRSDSAAHEFHELGAEAVKGDVCSPETLPLACKGSETVISLVGRHYARTKEILFATDAEGNRNLIRAAKDAGVQHFVLMSLLWADRDYAPVILPAKREAEKALREIGLGYSILRPSTFMTGPNSLVGMLGPPIERWGLVVIPAPDSGPISFISTADLAEAIVKIAGQPPRNRFYELGGSEGLTLRQGAAKIGSILNRTVRVAAIPRGMLRTLGTLLRPVSFNAYESYLFLEMMAEHGYHCAPDTLRQVLGRDPQTVDDSLRVYYSKVRRTAWSDSIYASIVARAR